MSVEKAIELLSTVGTRFSGSDWKYGYPHKFYIHGPDNHKFYTEHLLHCEDSLLEKFNELSKKCFDIVFSKKVTNDNKTVLGYYCVPGIQLWGIIREGGQVEHGIY